MDKYIELNREYYRYVIKQCTDFYKAGRLKVRRIGTKLILNDQTINLPTSGDRDDPAEVFPNVRQIMAEVRYQVQNESHV